MSSTSEAITSGSRDGSPLKVLVVDDEPTVRDFIRRALSRNGYPCRVAADAAEALASADAELPSLVISDVRMPGADGVWLLARLKERWPSLPVIMLTAVSDAATAVQCLKAGASDYLTKPIDLDELLIAIGRSVDFLRLARENREFRNDLETMRAKSQELRSAFHVIETTYREALGALTNVPSEGWSSRTLPALPAKAPSALLAPAPGKSPELLALHAGARLIADKSSFVEVAASVAGELVGGGAARALGVWGQGEAGRGIELVFSSGEMQKTRELALRSLSSGATPVDSEEDVAWVAAPVLIGGVIEAVLAIGWRDRDAAEAVAATERLALYLATAMKLERDAGEKHRIAEELELFQKLAIASRYSLDLHSVAHFLLDSLHRIVDYEVAGLLLLDEHQSLHLRTRSISDPGFVEQVRGHVLNTLKLTCGVEPDGELEVHVRHLPSPTYPSEGSRKLRSFVNVPLTIGNHVAGLIHISSGRERAFTNEDTLFLHRAAHFLASSVQGVRDLLAAVKGRIEQMVEQMTDGVLMLDQRGDVVAMNRAARLLLRIEDPDQRPGRVELAQLLELDAIELLRDERRSLRRLICVHGVPYQLQISPVSDGEDLVGVVVAFRNFTEEQRIDEMKTEFIDVASHELRTPLTAIKNAVAILQGTRLGETTAGQRRFLSLAQRNVDQLISIINDLLDLSKFESGKMQIDLEPTDIGEPVVAAVAALVPRAEEAGVSLETRIAEALPNVFAHGPSFQRVLTNLVGNAIKFTESGGRVEVEAKASENEAGEPTLRIVVSDTGAGIPKEDLETIFEKFHQLEQGPSPGVAGTGLGLPITRELVKAHHGHIHAESEPGEGSRFIIELPILSVESYFFRELDQELARTQGLQSSLALVLVSLPDRERLASRLGAAGYEKLFQTLADSTRRVLHRSTDRVLPRPDLGALAVVLPRTDRRGGCRFEARLLEEMKSTTLTRTGVDLTCGVAICPDEGKTARELFQAAAGSLSRVELMPA